MSSDERKSMSAAEANNNNIHPNFHSISDRFVYRPPNNAGTNLGILGGVLATVGDALAAIGAIIQLNTDLSADFQSQVDSFKSDQEKEKMQTEIDDLQEKVKELEQLIKRNQN